MNTILTSYHFVLFISFFVLSYASSCHHFQARIRKYWPFNQLQVDEHYSIRLQEISAPKSTFGTQDSLSHVSEPEVLLQNSYGEFLEAVSIGKCDDENENVAVINSPEPSRIMQGDLEPSITSQDGQEMSIAKDSTVGFFDPLTLNFFDVNLASSIEGSNTNSNSIDSELRNRLRREPVHSHGDEDEEYVKNALQIISPDKLGHQLVDLEIPEGAEIVYQEESFSCIIL